ncbi:hypothetical protein EDD86DRAFT_204171 [Gorgonomyces haynaldii]|nr:hypothetical protein EDD86DRAFT_204171 [Gorgonomyces haynaldii]
MASLSIFEFNCLCWRFEASARRNTSHRMQRERPSSDLLQTSTLRRPVSSQVEQVQHNAHSRPISEQGLGATLFDNVVRPVSANMEHMSNYKTPEAEVIDKWFEDLSYYEKTLETMARAKLDDNFREELKAMEQWFNVLTDVERTTVLYSLLKNANQVQIRFFITVLQQMVQQDPSMPHSIASSANRSRRGSVGTNISSVLEGDEDMLGHMNSPLQNMRIYDRSSTDGSRSNRTSSELPERMQRMSDPDGILYRRHNAEEKRRLHRQSDSDHPYEDHISPALLTPRGTSLLRPTTPVEDAINAVNWSVNVSQRTSSLDAPHTISRPISPMHRSPRVNHSQAPSEHSDNDEKGTHKDKGKIPESVDLELIKGTQIDTRYSSVAQKSQAAQVHAIV